MSITKLGHMWYLYEFKCCCALGVFARGRLIEKETKSMLE
jgi:hypothetical protein